MNKGVIVRENFYTGKEDKIAALVNIIEIKIHFMRVVTQMMASELFNEKNQGKY